MGLTLVDIIRDEIAGLKAWLASSAGYVKKSGDTMSGALVVPEIKPAANLVITQNAVSAMTMVAAAAVVNTLYLKEGKVGIGKVPEVTLDIVGTLTASGIVTQNGANLAGTAYQSQSFQNLLKNGDFESWSAGAAAAPDGWVVYASGQDREGTIKKIGTYSVKVTGEGTTVGQINQNYPDYSFYKGRTVTFGTWAHALSTNTYDSYIEIYDGISSTLSSYIPKDDAWHFMSITRVISGSATQLSLKLVVQNGAGTDIVYFDGAILVEGSVIPAFSPRPLYDDGKTLVIDSAANTVTSPKIITPSIAPAADLVITQNAVSAMTMVAAAAVVNTLYLKEGRVGIGTATPNAVALLDIASTTKGLLPPRMTTAQRDAIDAPPAGLMVYNATTNKLNVYTGAAWEAVTSA